MLRCAIVCSQSQQSRQIRNAKPVATEERSEGFSSSFDINPIRRLAMTRTAFALSALAFAGLAGAAAPAFAEVSKEVLIPKELKTDAQVTAYTDALLSAVDSVCWRTTAPMLAGSYDTYRACKKTKAIETAAKDPTGLLAARLGANTTVAIAAK
jgi:hypothetical protein